MRHVVEAREAYSGFLAALVIEDGAQVGDDGESVIEFKDARFDLQGVLRGEGATKIAEKGVIKCDHEADGRSAASGGLLVSGCGRIVVHGMPASCWLNCC